MVVVFVLDVPGEYITEVVAHCIGRYEVIRDRARKHVARDPVNQ